MNFLSQNVTISQCKDSGLALVLICLLLSLASSAKLFISAAILVQLVTMTAPGLFRPFAKVWFGLSHTLGTVVSKVLLSALFFLLVTPVGLIRRLLGKDAMQLKAWKTGTASVFRSRDHIFRREDLEHPY